MAEKKFSEEDISNLFDRNFSREKRTIYMVNVNFDSDGSEIGIEAMLSAKVIKAIHVLNADNYKPINLIMNTDGGNTFHGYGIYDAITSSLSPVDIEVIGQAMSMGAIILQAGRVRRLHQNAIVMIHDGYSKEPQRTPMRTVESWGDFSKGDRKRMYQLFAKRSGKTEKYWAAQCMTDRIYTPEEAIRVGLADEIIPEADWRKRVFNSKR